MHALELLKFHWLLAAQRSAWEGCVWELHGHVQTYLHSHACDREKQLKMVTSGTTVDV